MRFVWRETKFCLCQLRCPPASPQTCRRGSHRLGYRSSVRGGRVYTSRLFAGLGRVMALAVGEQDRARSYEFWCGARLIYITTAAAVVGVIASSVQTHAPSGVSFGVNTPSQQYLPHSYWSTVCSVEDSFPATVMPSQMLNLGS